MVFRYSNTLKEDPALREHLADLRLQSRRWALLGAPLLAVGLLAIVSVIKGLAVCFGACSAQQSFLLFAPSLFGNTESPGTGGRP
jgi:hypothetical protein